MGIVQERELKGHGIQRGLPVGATGRGQNDKGNELKPRNHDFEQVSC